MTTITADNILTRLHDVRQVKRGSWQARCPAHDDANPSLSVTEGNDGRVLLHCFAGCTYPDIIAALGFSANGNGNGRADFLSNDAQAGAAGAADCCHL